VKVRTFVRRVHEAALALDPGTGVHG